jgi:hypothetical protein
MRALTGALPFRRCVFPHGQHSSTGNGTARRNAAATRGTSARDPATSAAQQESVIAVLAAATQRGLSVRSVGAAAVAGFGVVTTRPR